MKIKTKTFTAILIMILLCMSSLSMAEVAASPGTRKDAVVKYILNLQVDKGGFKSFSKDDPNIKATFEAIHTLNLLDKLGKIKKNKIIEWINETLIVSDETSEDYGLIRERPGGEANIYSIYFGLQIFNILDKDYTEYLDQEYVINWVMKCNTDTVFSIRPNSSEKAIWTTYYAFSIIYTLNRTLWTQLSSNITNWLVTLQNPDGGFSLGNNVSSLPETYATIKILSLAGQIENSGIDIEKLKTWILERMLPDGSFEEIPGSGTGSLFTIYLAINILHDIDALQQLDDNRNKVIEWILSCQRSSGGFGLLNSTSEESTVLGEATMEATFYAISTLYLLDPELSSLAEKPWWELPLGLPLHIWLLLITVALVVILMSIYVKFRKI